MDDKRVILQQFFRQFKEAGYFVDVSFNQENIYFIISFCGEVYQSNFKRGLFEIITPLGLKGLLENKTKDILKKLSGY